VRDVGKVCNVVHFEPKSVDRALLDLEWCERD
jgi:hypothetical protein